jgi:hypothetical protein
LLPLPKEETVSRPSLHSVPRAEAPAGSGVTLAVYAPFGTDDELSTFPDGTSVALAEHPLLKHLLQVAEQNVGVVALIDRVDADSCLIEIPAGAPERLHILSRWKQDMASPRTLAGLLRHAHDFDRGAALVLALEGHGAGYLPDIDRRQLTQAHLTQNGKVAWRIEKDRSITEPPGAPPLPGTAPLLPGTAPLLPGTAPLLPVNHMPLSTYAIGHALKLAIDGGVPRLAAIHFDNCFNMSVEVLHTVAPHADYATGYMNYNFFTAGAAYPKVFERLRQAGTASAEQLARWFADENHAALEAKGNHPTAGGMVRLSRMQQIVERIDDLSDALLAALRTPPQQRAVVVEHIMLAILAAQQYDSVPPRVLEAPDEMTDISSFAAALRRFDFGPHKVHDAAAVLQQALEGIKQYGDLDEPWTDPGVIWDFSEPTLAMNIFLPDPLRRGLWDWRAPFYLDVNPDPALPPVQPNVIDFVKVTDWVDFLIEYHKDTTFAGLLPSAIPTLPAFNRRYVRPKPAKGAEPPKRRRPRA